MSTCLHDARMSSEAFPFVEVPERLHEVLGGPPENGRTWRVVREIEHAEQWFDAVVEALDPVTTVSPGGVVMFARVSRAAVYKRINEGRLTAFIFEVKEPKALFTPKTPGRYILIPTVESKAWGQQIKEQRERANEKN